MSLYVCLYVCLCVCPSALSPRLSAGLVGPRAPSALLRATPGFMQPLRRPCRGPPHPSTDNRTARWRTAFLALRRLLRSVRNKAPTHSSECFCTTRSRAPLPGARSPLADRTTYRLVRVIGSHRSRGGGCRLPGRCLRLELKWVCLSLSAFRRRPCDSFLPITCLLRADGRGEMPTMGTSTSCLDTMYYTLPATFPPRTSRTVGRAGPPFPQGL